MQSELFTSLCQLPLLQVSRTPRPYHKLSLHLEHENSSSGFGVFATRDPGWVCRTWIGMRSTGLTSVLLISQEAPQTHGIEALHRIHSTPFVGLS